MSNFTNFTPTTFYRHSFGRMTSLGEHFKGEKRGESRLELPKLGDAQQQSKHRMETIYLRLRSQRRTYQQRDAASSMCVLLSINLTGRRRLRAHHMWTERPPFTVTWCFMWVIADLYPHPKLRSFSVLSSHRRTATEFPSRHCVKMSSMTMQTGR